MIIYKKYGIIGGIVIKKLPWEGGCGE